MTDKVLGNLPPANVQAAFEAALALCVMGKSVLYLCERDDDSYYLLSAMEIGFAETKSPSISRISGNTVFFGTSNCLSIVSLHDLKTRRIPRAYDVLYLNPGVQVPTALLYKFRGQFGEVRG